MIDVTKTEYDTHIASLVSPSIDTIEECEMIITTHSVSNIEEAEKVEHSFTGVTIYKIKQ